MNDVLECGALTLQCVRGDSRRVAYLLYPMDVLGDWVVQAAARFGTSIVCVTGIDWDNDLSPWPAPGEPPGSPDFQGRATQFLRTLTQRVVPQAERHLGLSNPKRTLVGVSMSGLFTLWQRFQSPLFPTVATLSGSFWYPGFANWVERQSAPSPLGQVYMLLGRKESQSPVKAFRSVAEDTERILLRLRILGVPCRFDWVPGNHYANPLQRLDLTFTRLSEQGA